MRVLARAHRSVRAPLHTSDDDNSKTQRGTAAARGCIGPSSGFYETGWSAICIGFKVLCGGMLECECLPRTIFCDTERSSALTGERQARSAKALRVGSLGAGRTAAVQVSTSTPSFRFPVSSVSHLGGRIEFKISSVWVAAGGALGTAVFASFLPFEDATRIGLSYFTSELTGGIISRALSANRKLAVDESVLTSMFDLLIIDIDMENE